MCGIVGAVSQRNIVPILLQGLKRLEYRGYDSCGVAVHQGGELRRARSTSRVSELEANVAADSIASGTGIAHTRWATHGAPAVHNAHPHFSSGKGVPVSGANASRIALVHNGIIENHDELRAELRERGYVFEQPDRHRSHRAPDAQPVRRRPAGRRAARPAAPARRLRHCRVLPRRTQRVVGARQGSPLVLGVGSPGQRARTSWPATRWRWPA
jgi:glucosamine--fructose-6-phosphate aminotransferase (isomerizing)